MFGAKGIISKMGGLGSVAGLGLTAAGLLGAGGKSKQPSVKELQTMSPQQSQLMNQMTGAISPTSIYGDNQAYQGGMDYLKNLYKGTPESFNKMADPYMRQFHQQTIPDIANGFSYGGMGGVGRSSSGLGGNRASSGFEHATTQAAGNLSSSLGGMFEGLRGNLLSQLMNFSQAPFTQGQSLLQNQTLNHHQIPGTPGFGQKVMSGLAGGLGSSLGQQTFGGSGLYNSLLGGSNSNPAPTQPQIYNSTQPMNNAPPQPNYMVGMGQNPYARR